jgi:hypothetical protein
MPWKWRIIRLKINPRRRFCDVSRELNCNQVLNVWMSDACNEKKLFWRIAAIRWKTFNKKIIIKFWHWQWMKGQIEIVWMCFDCKKLNFLHFNCVNNFMRNCHEWTLIKIAKAQGPKQINCYQMYCYEMKISFWC